MPANEPASLYDVAIIGDDGNVWHRYWDEDVLRPWENLGAPAGVKPLAVIAQRSQLFSA